MIISPEQTTNLTAAITSGASEYVGIMIAIAAILIPIGFAVKALSYAMNKR